MLRGSLSTHFLHETGSLLIHFLLSRREDFEDPPTLKTCIEVKDLKTRELTRMKIETKQQLFVDKPDKATAKGEFVGALMSALCLYSVTM